MGTRNLEVVIANGEVRAANYCQWDGYPSGQGKIALEFFRDNFEFNQFQQKVLQCSWITEEEHTQMWTDVGADPKSDMVSFDVSKKFADKYPQLHRDCGAKIFSLIQESAHGLKLQNQIEFAADSLFCEWAYVVDLDRNTFEVYKGFNQKPLAEGERFAYLQKEKGKNVKKEYYPVKLVKSYSLSELPSTEDFLAEVEPKEEE